MTTPPALPNLFEALVAQAPDAIIFADREGRIVAWNAGAERVFGHATRDVVGESLDLIIPEHLRQTHWDAFDRAVASGTTRHEGRAIVTRSMRADGTKIYVDISFALVKDAAGTVVGSLAIARDATERRAAEVASRARIAELEKATSRDGREA